MLLPALMANRVSGQDISNLIRNEVASSVAAAEVMYRDLHQNPELSLMEFNTAAKMADALGRLGFEVTTGVGGNGVVGVLRNGKGPVIMLRADMDALPVRETTGLPFASTITVATPQGPETPVMHACGHDLHMTVWHGTVQTLVALKSKWKGTLVAIAQPAEEVSGGSDRMIADGLYSRFPKPDYALCYHVSADLPAGTVGYFPGAIFAGVLKFSESAATGLCLIKPLIPWYSLQKSFSITRPSSAARSTPFTLRL